MKLETYLNAMMYSRTELSLSFHGIIDLTIEDAKRRSRQIPAFRDRILFDFATREATIYLCQQRLREKDAEIDRLKYDLDWNINIIEQMRNWKGDNND